MKHQALALPERIGLAVLTLIIVLALFYALSDKGPGKHRIQSVNPAAPDATGKRTKRLHMFSRPTNIGAQESKLEWQADVDYQPRRGKIWLDLRNKDGMPSKGFAVSARFSADDRRSPAIDRLLQEQSDGRYMASVRLKKGAWLMTLRGWRNSRLEFLSEQTLNVQ